MNQTTLTGPSEAVPSTFFPPVWASAWGDDGKVPWASFRLDDVLFRFRLIPAGTFRMGSPEGETGRYTDEEQHEVILTRPLWIAETLCTQAQWRVLRSENPSQNQGEQLPVDSVTWDEVREFAKGLNERVPGLGARLPTEAEWEYACRAGTSAAFNDESACTKAEGADPALDRLGWYAANSSGKSQPVGGKLPNAWNLFDMHGNVWEWCADLADFDRAKLEVVSDAYPEESTDPIGSTGERRVVRGGSFGSVPRVCRSAIRDANGPGSRSGYRGFRLAAGHSLKSKSASGAGA